MLVLPMRATVTALIVLLRGLALLTQANVAAATEPLSGEEASALAHIRENLFEKQGPQCWHGVELSNYWANVGKALITKHLYTRREENASGGDASGGDVQVLCGLILLLTGIALLIGICTGRLEPEVVVSTIWESPPPPPPAPKLFGLF